MSRAVVALGSNLGERFVHLERALHALSLLPGTKALAVSTVYETEPVGYDDQPLFLNAVALLETELSPHALLGACLGIESALGRERTIRNGPRVIDLDVLLIEGAVLEEAELTLPHPRMGEREFVLAPLADIFPDGRPLGFDFSREVAQASGKGIRPFEKKLKIK